MTVMHTEHAPPYERVFDQSYERVHSGDEHGLNFFDGFYQNFLGLSDEIRDKFKNTDMPKQRSMLEKVFITCWCFTRRVMPMTTCSVWSNATAHAASIFPFASMIRGWTV